MNNEEISRYIHVEIMGKCVNPTVWVWEPGSPYETTMVGACPVCSKAHNNPDYCSDDSPRRLLNEVVAKVLTEGYADTYIGLLGKEHFIDTARWSRGGYEGWQKVLLSRADAFLLAHSTAEQIARAAVTAHQEAK